MVFTILPRFFSPGFGHDRYSLLEIYISISIPFCLIYVFPWGQLVIRVLSTTLMSLQSVLSVYYKGVYLSLVKIETFIFLVKY